MLDAALSPDGTHLAGVTEPNNNLCVMDLKSRTVQSLYKGIQDLEWVDNNRILFTVWNESAGGSVPLLTDLSGHVTNLTKIIGWSKAMTYRYDPIVGNDLYYLASETMQVPADLYATDLTTGSSRLIEKNVDNFYFSPDHQYAFVEVTLGMSSAGSQTAFELINPEGQVECTIRRNNNSTGREGVSYNVTWSPDGRYFAYTISYNDKDNAGLYIYDTKRNSSAKIESNLYGLTYWNPSEDNLAITYTIGSDNAYSSVFKIFYMTRVAGS
jgi:Tol biopolymer transport system component